MSGDELFIERRGHGLPVVLIHGWGLHGGVFASLQAELCDRYEVWTVDLPGFGGSVGVGTPRSLSEVAELIARRVPAGASWLGWSLGGLVTLSAAQGGYATRIALTGATPRFVSGDDWPWGVAPEVIEGFASELESDWRSTLFRFVALQSRGSARAREEISNLRRILFSRGEPRREALHWGLRLLMESDLRPLLATITVPALFIHGDRDTLVPLEAVEASARRMTGAEVVVIEGAGHAPFISHLDTFRTKLQVFLDE